MDLDGMKYVFTRLFALFLMILGYHVMQCKNITILSWYTKYLSDWLPHALSVPMWRNLIGLLKFLDKIACTVKSHVHGNLRHRCVGMGKKIFRLLHTEIIDIFHQGFSRILAEKLHKIILAVIGQPGKFRNRKVFLIMKTDMIQNPFTAARLLFCSVLTGMI